MNSAGKRVVVIGTVTRDTLWYPGRPLERGLGGILYNVATLASLGEYTVVPIANVGADIWDALIEILSQYPNVALDGVRRTHDANIHCHIFFASEYGTQYDEGDEVPIRFEQVEPYLASSLILANFTTGYDMSLSTFKRIASQATCPVFLDYHILALQRDRLGNRYVMRRRNWAQWLRAADIVQMNRFEAETLAGQRLCSDKDIVRFCRPLLHSTLSAMIVTLGCEGATLVYKDGPQVRSKRIMAPEVSATGVPTGCGDVFSAAFVHRYLQGDAIVDACEYASRIAGLKCTIGGYTEFASALAEGSPNCAGS